METVADLHDLLMVATTYSSIWISHAVILISAASVTQVVLQLSMQEATERLEALKQFARSTDPHPEYPPPPPLPAYLGDALEFWYNAETKQTVPL